MIRILPLAAALALAGCAAGDLDRASHTPPKASIIGNVLIIPADCDDLNADWRDAVRAAQAHPEQAALLELESASRKALALCIAPTIKEASMSLDLPALRTRRDTFNIACPPGSAVCVRDDSGRGTLRTTRAAATLMGSGRIVVWLEGQMGAVDIDRVTPMAAATS